MPTDEFELNARWHSRPQDGGLLISGAAELGAKIVEFVTLDQKTLAPYQLTADTPQQVAYAGVVNGNVVIVNADQPMTVQITSASGVLQSIPIDDQLIIISRTVPITAIQLVRTPGTLTNVAVFVGEMA